MASKKILSGGKLGDFIHTLCVCKYIYDTIGSKLDLYIANIGDNFEKPLEFTYNDLLPILNEQEWVNSFNIYNNEEIKVNLSEFRNSSLLYKENWSVILFEKFLFGNTIPKNYKWISIKEKDDSLCDTVLINRAPRYELSDNSRNVYINEIEKSKDCAFICFEDHQYESFPLKDRVRKLKCDSLYDFFVKLNSCKLYMGTLSGPTAFATALDIPRNVELPDTLDRAHYLGYENFSDNFKSF
jgi:hypothetical protein